MKRILVGVIAFVVGSSGAVFAGGPAVVPPPAASVALVSKVVLDVMRKEAERDWQKAHRGETLGSGDKVKTGEKSLAIVKFKDNSLVRVREKSELTVMGDVRGSVFLKSVNMERGVVGFNIKKQGSEEEFRFTSPTSVASIRGTGGQFTSDEQADTLTVIEGKVMLTNRVSSQSVEVEAGYTGISSPDGSVQTRPSTSDELRQAREASRLSEQDNKIEIEFRDRQGNQKRLDVEYKDR